MHSSLRRSVALLCALALTACTTLNVVDDRSATPPQDPPALTKSVRADDRVRITTLDGRMRVLRLTSVTDSELTGHAEGSVQSMSIPAAQVARIERRDFSFGKTSLLVLGVIATAALVVVAVEGLAAVAILSSSN